ncbi:MAG: sugar ABC transporter permease [Bacillota bacterium]|jgi:multiple sugar transport system permease protein|nr:sugar ABC transporter permease [Bacillota bacterium]HOB91150.1 sugar ABC transporter permease [Bacillota bacterium]HPZ54277.1 sugar ABC transporter permease [Bacillota bacterium]HQD17560.1 sugar ABC transporter permease [Bacillota bacterium]
MRPVIATSAASIPEPNWAQRLWKEIKANKAAYFFLAPYAILFFLFTVLPVLIAIGLSFTHYNMLQPPKWIGYQNYLRLFLSDDVFLIAVKNTFVFAIITGPLSYFACFVFAWLINDLQPRIRAVLTLMLYAPSISGSMFMIWTVMFSGDAYGYINGTLLKFGIIDEPIQFLTDPQWMMPVVIIVVLWMSLGTSFLAFIAGLQGVDSELYEAAAVDGVRNRWQELVFITLPQMKGYLMFGAIMSITNSFAAAAQIIPLVGFPSTDYAGHTIVTHLIDYGNVRFEMGYASAIAVILFVAMVGTQRLVQRLLNSLDS